MVRRGPSGRLAGFWRRRKRRSVVHAPQRHRLDDRQGWHRSGVAVGRDHGAHGQRSRRGLSRPDEASLGEPVADRVQATATPAQKEKLSKLSPHEITSKTLAGEPIQSVLSRAPGNNAEIGGVKVATENGWFAARPSGTEDIYKIYGESFRGQDHLRAILAEAQTIVDHALGATKGN